jgi:molybdopterin molybdotransferase
MVEYTQAGEGAELELRRGVAPGDNVVRPGDDFREGGVVVPSGRRLRPQDVGALAALGVVDVPVRRRPRVAILSTGNEIVSPRDAPSAGKIRDVNQVALAAQCRRAGADAILGGIAPDDATELERRASELLSRADALILSGGSSIGVRDLTAGVFAALGAEILFHGIGVRPGKPTILARVGDKPVIGMPGVPVSALVIFDAFVRPLVWRLGGEPAREPWPLRRRGRLTRRMPSVAGREDWVRVRFVDEGVQPLLGGSAALSTLVKADGVIVIPAGVEGVAEGDEVEVLLYEP